MSDAVERRPEEPQEDPFDDRQELAEVIAIHRIRAGWNQQELAAEAGVDKGYLSKIMNLRVEDVGRRIVKRLARAFGFTHSHFELLIEEQGRSRREAERAGADAYPAMTAGRLQPDELREESERLDAFLGLKEARK